MSRRVLIVDDEPNLRRTMRLTLEAAGYEVEDAPDGIKGVEMFADGSRFDAVLLDQRMPGMDGLQTLEQIRRRAPGACVIMVTAFGSIELAVDAMKLGATDFLRKPLTPETLRGALAAALSKIRPLSAPPRRPSVPLGSTDLPPAEVWTVNGFFIKGLPAAEGASADEHRFQVRHSERGPQGEVIVSIDPSVVGRVARASGRQLAASGAFWHQRAERALVNHLFLQATLPDGNRLVVDLVPGQTIELARTWLGD